MPIDRHPSLPRRPHSAQFLGARHEHEESVLSSTSFAIGDIVCFIFPSAYSYERVMPAKGSSEEPMSFKINGGDVDLEDPETHWFLDGRSIERFGCM